MYATRHVDWLSLTVDSRDSVNQLLPLSKFAYVGNGHHGYRSAFEDSVSGARVETDSPIANMDTHVTLSGQTLNKVRTWYGDGDDGLLAMARSVQARCSRVDLAVNIHDGRLTVNDFYSAYKSGALMTRARRAYYVEGIGDERAGNTMYFGSPRSDRQCRVYDKAAEQAVVDGQAWLRLELALRDLRAKSMVATTQDNSVAATISAHVEDILRWDEPEYLSSLRDSPVDILQIKRKKTNTERWLLEACAPALARVYATNPDFMVDFMTSFGQSFDKLSTKD